VHDGDAVPGFDFELQLHIGSHTQPAWEKFPIMLMQLDARKRGKLSQNAPARSLTHKHF
jgi:hypothetical protein